MKEILKSPEEYGYVMGNGICAFYIGPFSQWYGYFTGQYSWFVDSSLIAYNCCEQYMMEQKALLFNSADANLDIMNKILSEKNPAKQQELGRQIKNFDSTVWDENKYNIVLRGNAMKFHQNPHLAEFLKQFPIDTVFVEASPADKIWGVGLAITDPRVLDQSQWQGENLLGKVIQAVRKSLQ